MPRVFVRMPKERDAADFAETKFATAAGHDVYLSQTQPNVLTADVTADDRVALENSGAEIFEDVEFEPLGPFRPARVTPIEKEMQDAVGFAGPTLGLGDVVKHIKAPDAWKIARGAGVTVVIVDTGICGDLKEFPAAKRSPLDLPTAYSGKHWNDSVGHGSMCASIAAGTTAAGGRYDGVAPDATVLSARTTLMSSDIFKIYDEINARKINGELPGPVVFSNSYGSYVCSAPTGLPQNHPYLDVVRRAVSLNMPVIFAAGNNHWDVKCNHDPAQCSPNTIWTVNSHDDVLSIGTVDQNESNTDKATPHPNSSRGPGQWASKTTKPDCVAPTYGEVVWGCGYTTMPWWGTSGACPQVAGLAALILSKNNRLTATAVYDIIRNSCRAINGSKTCVGSGIIDCAAALRATP